MLDIGERFALTTSYTEEDGAVGFVSNDPNVAVADENGDLMDAVKDDIAHCTFTPALGDTFDTVGEQEIRVDYRREYIYDEEKKTYVKLKKEYDDFEDIYEVLV